MNMPSDKTTDERVGRAMDALANVREEYRSALVATNEELRGILESATGVVGEAKAVRTAAELGEFAAGRIDVERFSAFEESGTPVEQSTAARLEAAARTLESLIEQGQDLHFVRLEEGAELRDAVSEALGRAGRAFGAARTVELARSGKYDQALHGGWLDSFPPTLWNARERGLAPPLVVELEGSDLRPAGLADFLDGAQKIVLVVRGAAPPAALAGLITPGLTVLQVDDPADLSPMGDAGGPAIGAVVPADACRFVHLAGVAGDRGRLKVQHVPESEPKRPLGGISVFQQVQGMRQLAALSAGWGLATPEPGAPAGDGAGAPVPAGSAADRLAAWILRQADLSGLD
jgi:hypothetical protein